MSFILSILSHISMGRIRGTSRAKRGKNRRIRHRVCLTCNDVFKHGYAFDVHKRSCGIKGSSSSGNEDTDTDGSPYENTTDASNDDIAYSNDDLSDGFQPPLCLPNNRPMNEVSAYLSALNNSRGPWDLNHINAYREWGPKMPTPRLMEQAKLLGACDAGVGISEQHAQVILTYCRSRKGIPLPKTIRTCWKNIKRGHEKMCGPLRKVRNSSGEVLFTWRIVVMCVNMTFCDTMWRNVYQCYVFYDNVM
jgi:hypothetical protein